MDGLELLWVSLGSLVGLIVFFGRQLSVRHFKDYDDVKRKLANMTTRMQTLEDGQAAKDREFAALRNELEDTYAKAIREQAAREQAETAARVERQAREKAEDEAKSLAVLLVEMRANQDAMQKEIDEIKRDREERQKTYEASIAAERQAREQAEAVAAELRLTLTARTEKMQKQIDDLTAEIVSLKAKTVAMPDTPEGSKDTTDDQPHSDETRRDDDIPAGGDGTGGAESAA